MTEISQTLLILANVMFGEANILGTETMIAVGHVYINRLLDPHHRYGHTAMEVVEGFHGYDPNRSPTSISHRLAELVVQDRMIVGESADPTGGCHFVYSYQDISNLFGDSAACVREQADWQSSFRIIHGTMYRLYGYKEKPGAVSINASPLCDPKWVWSYD